MGALSESDRKLLEIFGWISARLPLQVLRKMRSAPSAIGAYARDTLEDSTYPISVIILVLPRGLLVRALLGAVSTGILRRFASAALLLRATLAFVLRPHLRYQ